MNARRIPVAVAAVAIAVLVLAHPATGQPATTDTLNRDPATDRWRQPRFAIAGGVFMPVHSTGARLISVRTGSGTEVVFESDLGLPDFTVEFRMEVRLRLGKRHGVDASLYSLKRNATQRLGRDIIWGADTLFIGLTVDSFWNIDTFDITYRFLPLQSQKWDLGLNAGLYVAGFSAGLLTREVDLGTVEEYTMPLPLLGVDVEFRPSRRVALTLAAQYFKLSVDEFRGHITKLIALGSYRLSPRFFVGIGFNFFDIEVEDIEEVQVGDNFRPQVRWRAEYRYSGPGVLIGLTF